MKSYGSSQFCQQFEECDIEIQPPEFISSTAYLLTDSAIFDYSSELARPKYIQTFKLITGVYPISYDEGVKKTLWYLFLVDLGCIYIYVLYAGGVVRFARKQQVNLGTDAV